MASAWSEIAADLPPWVSVPLFYIVGDFMLYWAHRAMHAPLLWPLHATHHSARDLICLTSTRLHPLEQFVGVIAIAVPFIMLGFSVDAVLICSLAMTAQGVLSHSSVPVPLWVQRVFHGRDTHRIHHGMDPALFNTNFARLAMWDRLFGTFHLMDARDVKTGVDDPRYDTGRPAPTPTAAPRTRPRSSSTFSVRPARGRSACVTATAPGSTVMRASTTPAPGWCAPITAARERVRRTRG